MTQKEIEAADILIKGATSHGVLYTLLFHPDEKNEAFRPITNVAVKYLEESGFLEVYQHHAESFLYRLTAKGLDLQRSGKNYSDYLEEQKQKTERENLHKDLQIQDLITKLNTINPNQLDFWKSQKERNKQATTIAIIAALFSLAALMKAWGFFGFIINF
jgi:hypothetical protein